MRSLLPVCVYAALLAAGSAASAQEDEQDAVVLKNGNRLYGELLGLYRGELSFSIDQAGAVDIDWNNVEALQSPRVFDVELESGERLSGSIESPSPGTLSVTAGTTPNTIEVEDVVRITPIADAPAARTSGYVDAGFDFLSANDEMDLTINAQLEHRTLNYLTTFSLDTIVSEIDDETAQRRNYFRAVSRRLLSNRWFALARLQLEEDRELDLDSRALFGIGAGRYLVRSNRAVLSLSGGLAGDREEYRGIAESERNGEVFVTLEWDWFELGGDTQVFTHATSFFSLDRSRRRLELDATLHRSIVGDVYWSVSVYESYDSDPPPDLESSDFGLSFTIGRAF